jgi:hypothetical protein
VLQNNKSQDEIETYIYGIIVVLIPKNKNKLIENEAWKDLLGVKNERRIF